MDSVQRPQAALPSSQPPQRTRWYERPDDRCLVLTLVLGSIVMIFFVASIVTLGEHIEESENPLGFVKTLNLGAKLFGVACPVILSSRRLLGETAGALRNMTSRQSPLGKAAHNERIMSISNAIFLSLVVVGFTRVVMYWIPQSCQACDPETEKSLRWHLSQGTREHVKDGLREWGTALSSSLSNAYGLQKAGMWSYSGEDEVTWGVIVFLAITGLSTATQWYGDCLSDVVLWYVCSVIVTVGFGIWFVGNAQYLFSRRLDDTHFVFVWFFAVWYFINEAPRPWSC